MSISGAYCWPPWPSLSSGSPRTQPNAPGQEFAEAANGVPARPAIEYAGDAGLGIEAVQRGRLGHAVDDGGAIAAGTGAKCSRRIFAIVCTTGIPTMTPGNSESQGEPTQQRGTVWM
jgi:hypothetical protein